MKIQKYMLAFATLPLFFLGVDQALSQAQTQQDNSASVTRPDTPSRRMRIPFPPLTGGCHHLVGSKWQDIPCATPEQMKKRPALTPIRVPSILATAPAPGQPPATPIVWGSVTVQIHSDPVLATEVDTMLGPNAFSIQANTDFFPCTKCSAGSPLPVSQAGDFGFVQFGVQVRPADVAAGSYTTLCIEQWDKDANQNAKTHLDNCSMDLNSVLPAFAACLRARTRLSVRPR